MATVDYKVCKHFHMLELKQSFVEATDQQTPALQQFEWTICQFAKHSARHKTVRTQNCYSKCPPSASMQQRRREVASLLFFFAQLCPLFIQSLLQFVQAANSE